MLDKIIVIRTAGCDSEMRYPQTGTPPPHCVSQSAASGGAITKQRPVDRGDSSVRLRFIL